MRIPVVHVNNKDLTVLGNDWHVVLQPVADGQIRVSPRRYIGEVRGFGSYWEEPSDEVETSSVENLRRCVQYVKHRTELLQKKLEDEQGGLPQADAAIAAYLQDGGATDRQGGFLTLGDIGGFLHSLAATIIASALITAAITAVVGAIWVPVQLLGHHPWDDKSLGILMLLGDAILACLVIGWIIGLLQEAD